MKNYQNGILFVTYSGLANSFQVKALAGLKDLKFD